jgi:hypothetical protein
MTICWIPGLRSSSYIQWYQQEYFSRRGIHLEGYKVSPPPAALTVPQPLLISTSVAETPRANPSTPSLSGKAWGSLRLLDRSRRSCVLAKHESIVVRGWLAGFISANGSHERRNFACECCAWRACSKCNAQDGVTLWKLDLLWKESKDSRSDVLTQDGQCGC